MSTSSLSRRTWIKSSLLAAGAAATGVADLRAEGPRWPVGCFNRPWVQKNAVAEPVETPQPVNWGFDAALDGMKQAGYKLIGLLTRAPGDPFIGSEATPDYLDALKKKIAAAGLVATVASLRTKPDATADEGIQDARAQIDHAQQLGLHTLLTFGVDDRGKFDTYRKIMADAADYAQERGLKLVIKPHGGVCADGAGLLDCVKQVGRPNFKIWYDAGNIIYYTGKDPITELAPVIDHVTGFCAKDCAGPKGEVMLRFGRGKVDFHGVFAALKNAGFAGPIFVECAAGKTFTTVTRCAQLNKEFVEAAIASLGS